MHMIVMDIEAAVDDLHLVGVALDGEYETLARAGVQSSWSWASSSPPPSGVLPVSFSQPASSRAASIQISRAGPRLAACLKRCMVFSNSVRDPGGVKAPG